MTTIEMKKIFSHKRDDVKSLVKKDINLYRILMRICPEVIYIIGSNCINSSSLYYHIYSEPSNSFYFISLNKWMCGRTLALRSSTDADAKERNKKKLSYHFIQYYHIFSLTILHRKYAHFFYDYFFIITITIFIAYHHYNHDYLPLSSSLILPFHTININNFEYSR